MNTLWALVRRNLWSYLRDRLTVFLSVLSAVILLLLYLLFLGNLQINQLRETLPQASESDIRYFVGSWVFAGIATISAFTTGLGALGVYVDDRVAGRFKDFRVSPIGRPILTLGYQLAGVVVAMLISTLILVAGAVLMGMIYGQFPSALQLLHAFGLVLIIAAAFSALSSFALTFIRSIGAFTAVSTIVGTLLGFLAGAYLPVGLLSEGIVNGINALPFSWAAMLLREPLAGAALDEIAMGVSDARQTVAEYYGFTLSIGDFTIQPLLAIVGLLGVAVLFTLLGSWRIGRTIQ